MGNEFSSETNEYNGYRILGIQESSPASCVGFVSFFDFITHANDIRLDEKDTTLLELIGNSKDKLLKLKVYNVKEQKTREVALTPSHNWKGKGLIGMTIRFDSYECAEDEVIHVMEVLEDSPASAAGLERYSDYLLGTPERVFRDVDDFHEEIMDSIDVPLQCYVYNSKKDQVRIVTILPHNKWKGEGYLGAEVGFGYLHRLPEDSRTSTGESIGFVSIPDNIMAATDTYAQHKPSSVAPDNMMEDEQSNIENVIVQDNVEHEEKAVDDSTLNLDRMNQMQKQDQSKKASTQSTFNAQSKVQRQESEPLSKVEKATQYGPSSDPGFPLRNAVAHVDRVQAAKEKQNLEQLVSIGSGLAVREGKSILTKH